MSCVYCDPKSSIITVSWFWTVMDWKEGRLYFRVARKQNWAADWTD